MALGKCFGRARQSFIFWVFFSYFPSNCFAGCLILHGHLERYQDTEATHQVGSTLHSSAEFLLVPAVMAQQATKTQKLREGKKNNHVWSCWTTDTQVEVPWSQQQSISQAGGHLGIRAPSSPQFTPPRLPRARAAQRDPGSAIPIPVQAPMAAVPLFPF